MDRAGIINPVPRSSAERRLEIKIIDFVESTKKRLPRLRQPFCFFQIPRLIFPEIMFHHEEILFDSFCLKQLHLDDNKCLTNTTPDAELSPKALLR
jgi:hypothetical protein